jgi:hypothetical protein
VGGVRRQRLRPAWTPEQLAGLYSEQHCYTGWKDHRLRVPVTTQVINWMLAEHQWSSAADLSAGDGAMLDESTAQRKVFGDLVDPCTGSDLLAPGYVGPIEQTIHQIRDVDLLVCTETIEHLDDPDGFLKTARTRVKGAVFSTPVGSWNDPTPGHYWAWDREAVEDILRQADFHPVTYLELGWSNKRELPHTFGIWGCV